jgi:REP element-mobilizing transposase RayT
VAAKPGSEERGRWRRSRHGRWGQGGRAAAPGPYRIGARRRTGRAPLLRSGSARIADRDGQIAKVGVLVFMTSIWRSRGYLPHWDRPAATQFITFRLADSLPLEFVRRWNYALNTNPEDEWLRADFVRATDVELDRGIGACHLRDPRIAKLVEEALLHFDGDRYRLLAWVVMPNHVHVIVEMTFGVPLAKVVHTWKWRTGRLANTLLKLTGRFWQPDYFDRVVGREDLLCSTRIYVEANPVKAGLCQAPKDWPYGSARLRV